MVSVYTFSGNVVADAELRETRSGEKVLGFRVGNNVGFGDNQHTNWCDCSVWGKRGESLNGKVRKGDKVVVSGELKHEKFERRDGSEGWKLSIRVNEIDLGGKPDSDQRGNRDDDRGNSRGGYSNDRGGNRGGGGGRDYGDRDSRGGAGGRGGGKPAFDDDLSDEIPF